MSAILVHVDVMEIAKEEREEIGKARDVVIVKREMQQLTKVESTQQMMTDELRSGKRDTPVEKNEEAM